MGVQDSGISPLEGDISMGLRGFRSKQVQILELTIYWLCDLRWSTKPLWASVSSPIGFLWGMKEKMCVEP